MSNTILQSKKTFGLQELCRESLLGLCGNRFIEFKPTTFRKNKLIFAGSISTAKYTDLVLR